MTGVQTADQIEITLSTTQKSIVMRKDERVWIQTIAEVENVFRGAPVHICMIRHLTHANREFFDRRNGLIFKQDRTRVITWIDRKKYTTTGKKLHRLLDGEIRELSMVKYTGRIRKLQGMVK